MTTAKTSSAPQRPSAATREAYTKALDNQVDKMGRSLRRWLLAAYRADPPAVYVLYAADASPADKMRRAMAKLAKRWLAQFDEFASPTADLFARRTRDGLARDLRNTGFTIRYRATRAMTDAFDAVRNENVSLIKSIAQQHLTAVEGLVQRTVSAGFDLSVLAGGLEKQLGVTKRRAAFIARDQAGKSLAMMQRAQYLEMGFTKGKWLHSAGGAQPRPEHVAFSGKVFDLVKGHDFEDGEGPTWPGVPVNCRCVFGPAIEGIDY
jgi:uncharacterized protein with gpF-like domain